MLEIAHQVLVAIYVALPPIAFVLAVVRAKRLGRSGPVYFFMTTGLAGMVLGVALTMLYARLSGGSVGVGQALLAGYFTASVLLFIRCVDWVLRRSIALALRLPFSEIAQRKYSVRHSLYSVTRAVLFVALGWPYVIAIASTYRPKVGAQETPLRQFGFAFEPVAFDATDGTHLRGWWIPAPSRDHSTRTVVVCHGLGGNKSSQLLLARDLIPAGYNVLVFDFRAHGESAGQITTYGDLERRDVLGAVRWIRATHAEQSETLFGVGVSTGAAALIAAAADPGPEGQAISAVALYAPFARFDDVADSVLTDYFLPPLNWLSFHIGLPMASLQSGGNLTSFAPGALADHLWPRPVLIIHGVNDPIIPFNQSLRLYHSISIPKDSYWLDHAGHEDILRDDAVSRYIVDFFQSARPLPVI
jgi:alpha-beta hydrolase superfamily lysophospholipase